MHMYLMLLAIMVSGALGGCLTDNDLPHTDAEWATRLFEYSIPQVPLALVPAYGDLTFMSFNLQSGYSYSCLSDPSAQGTVMKSAQYVANQEVVMNVDTRCDCDMPSVISESANMDTRFLMTFPYRTGKYGIMASTNQAILETKTVLFAYPGTEQRAAVAVLTRPSQLNGAPLWFVSTHLDYDSWYARQSQVQQLIKFVNETLLAQNPDAAIVVAGDFNGGPDDQMYPSMSKFFKNAWQEFSQSTAGGFTLPAGGPAYRFDHIWYRFNSLQQPFSVKNVKVVDALASDHRPLIATFSFGGSA